MQLEPSFLNQSFTVASSGISWILIKNLAAINFATVMHCGIYIRANTTQLTISTDKLQINRTALLIGREMGHPWALTLSTRTHTPSTQTCKSDQACVMGQPFSDEKAHAAISLFLSSVTVLMFMSLPQKLSSQPFSGLTFDTDYMVRVIPFPSLMNESFFPPSFLRTNCECSHSRHTHTLSI